MDSPRVLVFTADIDPTADHVVRHLIERRVPFARLDGSHFPQRLSMATTLGVSGPHGTGPGWSGTLEGLRKVDVSAVRSLYWRRPSQPKPAEALTGGERQWCVRQASHALWGLLRALPARLVNDPALVDAWESKPVNLAAAQACGLTIPPTLITNDPAAAADFASCYGPVVYKPLDGRGPRDADGLPTGAVYVTEVPPDLSGDPGIAATAHCFQQRVMDKDHDLRVTVVGDRVFAVEIRADDGAPLLDWRARYGSLEHRVGTLPAAETAAVARLMTRAGLHFATLDFVVRRGGQHLLVDVNPNGQFAWLEYETGLPISSAIADLLMEDA